MGRMALGYGSEFHLLRWLGRHRRRFTELVCGTRWKNIEWLDFSFADEVIPDEELLGINFLKDEDLRKVEREFFDGEFAWPNVPDRHLMNWDAVGIADDGTYVLCEAKAHVEEIERKGCGAGVKSARKIRNALKLPITYFEASASVDDWLRSYYQMANRLYVVALLAQCGIKAVFSNILFIGDHFPGRGKVSCPENADGWRDILDDEYCTLGLNIDNQIVRNHVLEVFVPVMEHKGRTNERGCV